METTKLSTKGQVVLPKSIRDARQWTAGMEFSVEETQGGIVLRPLKLPPSSFEDVAGCLCYTGGAKTLKQMDNAISKEIRKRRVRGRY